MTSTTNTVPFVSSIFHPSDFSKSSELAFAHALAIALFRKTELVMMHAGGDRIGDWAQFPPVRKTLENWQVLAPGSPRSAVYEKLSMSVTKVSAKGNPVEASIRQIEKQNRTWLCSRRADAVDCRCGSSRRSLRPSRAGRAP